VVHPLFVYGLLRVTEGLRVPLWDYYPQYFSYGYLIGVGPAWFIETLLIFTLVYVLWRQIGQPHPVKLMQHATFPSNRLLAIFALGMGLAGFIVRLKFPVDWTFKPLNLQLPFFAQYIAMFSAGLLAYRHGWLEKIPARAGRFWLWVAGVVVILYVPGALLGGAMESDLPFKGGWHWQALYYALWEAYLCVSLCIGVLYLFQCYADRQSRFATSLSRSAYAAYLIQAPVITGVALLLRDLPYQPLLKFVLALSVAVPLSFAIGELLRRLPYARRVL